MKKRWIVGIVFLLLVAGVTSVVINRPAQPNMPENKQATRSTTTTTTMQIPNETPPASLEPFPSEWETAGVVAKGQVKPVHFVQMNYEVSGYVQDVLVKPGDSVEEGDPLIRLDDRKMRLDVEASEVTLEKAKIEYRALQQGPQPAAVAAAEAKVRSTEAELNEAKNEVLPEDIESARTRIAYARQALAELDTLPKETSVRAAQAKLDQALSSLSLIRAEYANKKAWDEKEIERKAHEIRNAQDDYSAIYWDNRKQKLDKESEEWLSRKSLEERALRSIKTSELALEQAQIVLNEHQEVERFAIQNNEATVRENQALVEETSKPPTEADYAMARMYLKESEAQLANLYSPKRDAMIRRMQAQQDLAQAELAQVTAPPREIDLAMQEMIIREREVYLKEARLKLEMATLNAPMNGTVVEVNIKEGELYDAYRSEYVIMIADLSQWEVQTSNLADTEIVRINDKKPVTITFDALPDVSLSGRVKRIEYLGEEQSGHTVYTVFVELNEWDERVRWKMPATVTFATVD